MQVGRSEEPSLSRRDAAPQSAIKNLDEPVLAAGILARAGPLAVDEERQRRPLARIARALRGKEPARWLPQEFALAVTATKAHAFRYPDRTDDEIAAWERSAVWASSRPGGHPGVILHLEAVGRARRVGCTGTPEDIEAIVNAIG